MTRGYGTMVMGNVTLVAITGTTTSSPSNGHQGNMSHPAYHEFLLTHCCGVGIREGLVRPLSHIHPTVFIPVPVTLNDLVVQLPQFLIDLKQKYLIVAWWRHMVSSIWVNYGSGNPSWRKLCHPRKITIFIIEIPWQALILPMTG